MMRVFIVAASPLARAGLENILAVRGVEVAGTASSVEWLAEHLIDVEVDVVLVDASGEELDAILGSIGQLEVRSEATFVLLRDHPAPGWITEAARAGVGAILSTGASPEQIVAAMQAALAGLVVMDRAEIDSAFPAVTSASRPQAELAEPLTRREREVLQMLASGLGNKAIATQLAISEHTIKFHVASILGKLGATSRTEAVALGIRHGLVLL
jgi:two-component system, NarL family, response regulator YdfI